MPHWNGPTWICPASGCLFANASIRNRCRNCGASRPGISPRQDAKDSPEPLVAATEEHPAIYKRGSALVAGVLRPPMAVKKMPVKAVELLQNCQVEWDRGRGVLYVHNKDTGATVVRICGLRRNCDVSELGFLDAGQIDITLRDTKAFVLYPYSQTVSEVMSDTSEPEG